MSRGGRIIKINKHFGEYLSYLRFMKQLEVREMAKEIGIASTTYHDLERGNRTQCGHVVLVKIIAYLFLKEK